MPRTLYDARNIRSQTGIETSSSLTISKRDENLMNPKQQIFREISPDASNLFVTDDYKCGKNNRFTYLSHF